MDIELYRFIKQPLNNGQPLYRSIIKLKINPWP